MIDFLKLHGLVGSGGSNIIVKGLGEQIERNFTSREEIQEGDFITFNREGKVIKAKSSFKIPKKKIRLGTKTGVNSYTPDHSRRIHFLKSDFGIRIGVIDFRDNYLYFDIYELRDGKYFKLASYRKNVVYEGYVYDIRSVKVNEESIIILLNLEYNNDAYRFCFMKIDIEHYKNKVMLTNQYDDHTHGSVTKIAGSYLNGENDYKYFAKSGSYNGEIYYDSSSNNVSYSNGRSIAYGNTTGEYIVSSKNGLIMYVDNNSYKYIRFGKLKGNGTEKVSNHIYELTRIDNYYQPYYPFIIPTSNEKAEGIAVFKGRTSFEVSYSLCLYKVSEGNTQIELDKFKHLHESEIGYINSIVWAGTLKTNVYGVIIGSDDIYKLIEFDIDLNVQNITNLDISFLSSIDYNSSSKLFIYTNINNEVDYLYYEDETIKGAAKNSCNIDEDITVVFKGKTSKILDQANKRYYVDENMQITDDMNKSSIGYTDNEGNLIIEKAFWEV